MYLQATGDAVVVVMVVVVGVVVGYWLWRSSVGGAGDSLCKGAAVIVVGVL